MPALLLVPPKILFQTSPSDWAAATGGDAVLFTDSASQDRVRSHVQTAFRRIEFFDNFNTNDLVEKRAVELHAATPFHNIVPLAEIDVLRAARLRERLNISGMPVQDAILFRDKYEMKKRARSKGVPVAEFRLVDDALALLDFVAEVGYPIVVKPVDGRGSAGVQVIQNERELDAYLASGAVSRNASPLVEAYVDGEMFQVNGLYLDGQCVLISAVQCVNSNLQFLNGMFLGLKMLDEANALKKQLFAFTRNLLDNALPMPPNGLFHIEIFHAHDGRLMLCEAACRQSGCIANDEIRAAFGVDIRLEFLKSQCIPGYRSPLLDGGPARERMIGQLNIPPASGVLKSIPRTAPFEWVEYYKVNGVPGQRYEKMALTNGEIASFLIRGQSEVELEDRFHQVVNWFSSSAEWQATHQSTGAPVLR